MKKPEIAVRVPGAREYALVLRLALGGVAILKDLDAGALDDLRNASDEACDCLLHQSRAVDWLEMSVWDEGRCIRVRLCGVAECEKRQPSQGEDETEIALAVLETLVPQVAIDRTDCGCVCRIDLTLPKAAAVEA